MPDIFNAYVVAPCKNCIERHDNCHSSCSKYREFKDYTKRSYRNREIGIYGYERSKVYFRVKEKRNG